MTSAHLRFRRATSKAAALGQVSTPLCIVEKLLEDLPQTCRRILDLGAGDGRLGRAALRQLDATSSSAPGALAVLVEVDESRAQTLRESAGSRERVLHLDVLRDDAGKVIKDVIGAAADAVLSNPPYLEARLTDDDVARVREIFPFLAGQKGWMRADVVFAAHAWAASSLGSFIGLILPAPALTLPRFRALREVLVSQLEGLTVSQLPSRVFRGAEVDAFLVTGVRAVPGRRQVVLRQLDAQGAVTGSMSVSPDAAIARLDYAGHAAGLRAPQGSDTLGMLGVSITRGSQSRAAFRRAGVEAFHVSDFPTVSAPDAQVHLATDSGTHHVAQEGDVLIPRVGSRCLTRETRVAGRGVFTDSVYRLRGEPHVMRRVWRTLRSEHGRAWRAARAVGSCAKHLPLWVLLDMPVLDGEGLESSASEADATCDCSAASL
jgi:predicted RNA methylase